MNIQKIKTSNPTNNLLRTT